MSVLIVTSALPGDGKSVLAVGMAGALRDAGSSVHLVRLPGGDNAVSDAEAFARLSGVRSPGGPQRLDPSAVDADVTIAEAASFEETAAPREQTDAQVVLVTRFGEAVDHTLHRVIEMVMPAALVINAVPDHALDAVQQRGDESGVPIVAVLPQDRLLAAPLISAMATAVAGDLRGASELHGEAVEWLQIGPISAHSGIDYFSRYPDKAVITRHDKLDVALAALDSEPACLILTGGEPRLPYVAQRAESEEFALIVTELDTADATARIGELYAHSPFSGERKVQRAVQMLQEHVDVEALRRLAGV